MTDFYLPDGHTTHPYFFSASIDAFLNDTDLECGSSYTALETAVKEGLITEKELDVSLRRLLKAKFQLGIFDPDGRVPYFTLPHEIAENPEHQQHALEMARKAIVLLKNENNALPLNKSIRKIAVIGPNANDIEI
jgi:beta-glucosidase